MFSKPMPHEEHCVLVVDPAKTINTDESLRRFVRKTGIFNAGFKFY